MTVALPYSAQPCSTAKYRPLRVFVCPLCHRTYGDPRYHGPVGHAPQNLCFDCWTYEWSHIKTRMLNGGDWTVLDSALWLICCGFTHQQAANIIGIARQTIRRWLQNLRRNPGRIPQWLQRDDSPASH